MMSLQPTSIPQASFIALGVTNHWLLASSMLINNLITSSLLTWAVMPFVTRSMSFWLQPAHQSISTKTNILGTAIVSTALIGMAILFNLVW